MALTNDQFDSIIKIYKEKQLANSREQEARLQYVYENVPGYKEADEAVSSIGLAALKARLENNNSNVHDAYSSINELAMTKKKLLVDAGLPANYLEIQYDCPDCKDTGYINNQKCHCFKKMASSLLSKKSNMDLILSECSFDLLSYGYYDGENLQRFKNTVTQCRTFVQKFSEDYENLLFYGTVGTGKSFLSGCIARELLADGFSVVYYSSTKLFELLSDIMFDKKDRATLSAMHDEIYDSDLLIIDDLGTELLTGAVSTSLFSLLNERHLNKKSVIISTNYSLKELQDRYSERIFSRLLDWYSIHKIDGPDIRRIKKVNS